jgi:fumarylacetoacetase
MPVSHSSYRHAYWAPAHLLTHHSSNGCQLRPGDLLGTGTQSGPGAAEQGCLLELTEGGHRPLTLENGELRGALQDDDTVSLRAWCEGPGRPRIGFGDCRGTVLPASNGQARSAGL